MSSVFQKAARGAAEVGVQYTSGLVANKLAEQRAARLAQISSDTRAADRAAEAEFEDSRYAMETDRELDTYERKKQIDKEYATVKVDKGTGEKWKLVDYPTGETDEMGNAITEPMLLGETSGRLRRPSLDENTPGGPSLPTAEDISKLRANQPEKTFEEFQRAAAKRGVQIPDTFRETWDSATPSGKPPEKKADLVEKIKGMRLQDAEQFYAQNKDKMSPDERTAAERWLKIKRDPAAHQANVKQQRAEERESKSVLEAAARQNRLDELKAKRDAERSRIEAWNQGMK